MDLRHPLIGSQVTVGWLGSCAINLVLAKSAGVEIIGQNPKKNRWAVPSTKSFWSTLDGAIYPRVRLNELCHPLCRRCIYISALHLRRIVPSNPHQKSSHRLSRHWIWTSVPMCNESRKFQNPPPRNIKSKVVWNLGSLEIYSYRSLVGGSWGKWGLHLRIWGRNPFQE